MGAPTRPSHHWTSAAEPHALRRKLIMQRYGPQVRELMGNNPWTVVPVTVATVLQTVLAFAVGYYDMSWWHVLLLGYVVSPFLAGNLMAAHHEISHFLVFKRASWNRVLMCIANTPLSIPLGTLFKQYHQEHHSHMGVDGVDTGIWLAIEARCLDGNWLQKTLFLIIFPFFFYFRPFLMLVNKKPELYDLVCWLVVPAYDIALCYSTWSVKPMAYMLLGLWFGVGLHPIAGHVISEHVMVSGDGQETHSCYDPLLNPLLYNFGYHVEHHDFTNIPWNRLPQLRDIAPEFYNHLSCYSSWTYCMYKFISDPSVGRAGVMTKRVERIGGSDDSNSKGGSGLAAAARRFTPAMAMPLLRGLTPTAIH